MPLNILNMSLNRLKPRNDSSIGDVGVAGVTVTDVSDSYETAVSDIIRETVTKKNVEVKELQTENAELQTETVTLQRDEERLREQFKNRLAVLEEQVKTTTDIFKKREAENATMRTENAKLQQQLQMLIVLNTVREVSGNGEASVQDKDAEEGDCDSGGQDDSNPENGV